MMSEFSKIYGSAEKQIEAQLNDLEKNIKNIKNSSFRHYFFFLLWTISNFALKTK